MQAQAERPEKKPSAVVLGVGAEHGLGAAVARRFAASGFHLFIAGRTPDKIARVAETITTGGGSAEPVTTDAVSEADVERLFTTAFAKRPDVEIPSVVVFNAGNNARIPFLELTAAQFEDFWRVGCYAGFLVGQAAARRLLPLGRGTILFTGASGSLRGRPNYVHFAAAKAGLRMLSQSMAREYGPAGLHVAHGIIDGGINGGRLRSLRPDVVSERGEDGLLETDAIAETYWQLHQQPPSAWTQELDLRPFKESF
jgi:NAD(P)-dependent dehydrogenase (short-subunit alcohol dehydrogenase family)